MNQTTSIRSELDSLQQIVEDLLNEAKQQGATAAEAGVSTNQGLSVTVRLGETETVEHTRDHGLGITVYFGQRKGNASTTDLSPAAVRETVSKACTIARYTSEDEFSGLGDAALMATGYPDLDLCHPWEISVDQATDMALACEDSARRTDHRISNSEGATLNSHAGSFVYGNTHGFVGGYPFSRHSISCAVVAQQAESMQRDYWYSNKRHWKDLETPAAVGKKAADRTLAKLNARKLGTRQAPVVFRNDVAPSLLRSLTGAIQGHAQYRQSSFLLDALHQQIFPDWVHIHEAPLIPGGLASAPFDSEGIATSAHDFVHHGILQNYVLDSYSARKLGLVSTGNAGGVRNLAIDPGQDDLAGLLHEMREGLLITELMGQGLNPVTGDYSRGAAGFWVEQGEIQYPVEEITIAGNMRDMFRQLLAVGNDEDSPGSIRTGSWLIESMTIAGS